MNNKKFKNYKYVKWKINKKNSISLSQNKDDFYENENKNKEEKFTDKLMKSKNRSLNKLKNCLKNKFLSNYISKKENIIKNLNSFRQS